MSTENHLQIWHDFKNGDWAAYTNLYNDYFSLLNNYGYKFTKDTELIEDAIHDLFVRLWATRASLGNPVSVKNYLYKSLRNTLFRKLQAAGKFTGFDNSTFPVAFEVSFRIEPKHSIEEKELQEEIKNFINRLPARQQEIIFLRFYESLSYEEISDIMSINIGSAYKLLYKALESLQQLLGTSYVLGSLLLFKQFL